MSEFKILADLDAADLRENGLLSDGDSFGTPSPQASGSQKIHKRRLNNSSDKENQDISLNVSPTSPAAQDAFATIPVNLISYDTLLYVGFTAAKATELWNRWRNWPADGPRREIDSDDEGGVIVTFKDIIVHSIDGRANAMGNDDALWRTCLGACGIAQDVQDAIMDPHFRYLRQTESCLHWISDTLRMRYAGLQDIQRTSRKRDSQLRRLATSSGRSQGGSGQGGRQLGANVAANPAAGSSSSASQDQRSVSGTQRQNASGVSEEVWSADRVRAASSAPGYTTLYRSMDQGRIADLFDDDGKLFRIGTIASRSPSDFSGNSSRFYFSPQYEVAVYYAAFAKRRAGAQSIVIICLRVKNSAIESLRAPAIQRIYWPNDEWKELIWRCRTDDHMPTHLQKYGQALLVIGTIAAKPNPVYSAMRSWHEITERHVVRLGSRGEEQPAVQYVFANNEDGRDFLMENGARNLKVFGYPQNELEAWLAANPA